MEALVILLAEFLYLPLMACAALIIDAAVAIIALLFNAVLSLSIPTIKRKELSFAGANNTAKTVIMLRNVSVALLALIVVCLIAINSFFLDPVTRWVAGSIAERTGIKVAFAAVEGNLFTGHFVFSDLTATRNMGGKTKFSFAIQSTELDVAMSSLIFRPVTFEKVTITGVKGDIIQNSEDSLLQGNEDTQKIRTKRDFIIEDLKLSNINLSLSKDGRLVSAEFENIASAPFRSHYAVFDIFFRSNVAGKINGHNISIITSGAESERKTQWRIVNLPVKTLSDFVATPPLAWFKDGIVDINVMDKWALKQKVAIDMDWHLTMHGIRMEVPQDATLLHKAVGRPIAAYLNHKADADIQFTLVIDEEKFAGVASLDAAGLWDEIAKSIAKTIATSSGENLEKVQDNLNDKVEGFKSFMDRRRR